MMDTRTPRTVPQVLRITSRELRLGADRVVRLDCRNGRKNAAAARVNGLQLSSLP
jgi:hypothetical protein